MNLPLTSQTRFDCRPLFLWLVSLCVLLLSIVPTSAGEESAANKSTADKPVADKPVEKKVEKPTEETPVPVESPAEPPEDQKPAPAEKKDDELPWLDSVAAGYREAQQERQPILIRAGGEWCPWCRVLENEIGKPIVQEELKRWTRVVFDVDKSPGDAKSMRVGPLPAMRLVTPGGKIVASQDGAMTAEELVAWLEEHYEIAAALPPPELISQDEPTDDEIITIIGFFERRDAMIREAAIRRLSPYPHAAATATAQAFQKGSLAQRLAALELLQQWKAPINQLDPWVPESYSEERFAVLDKWVQKTQTDDFKSTTTAQTLNNQQRIDARDAIAKMVVAEPAEATAIRERLARFGASLLPEVYAQLKEARDDLHRERLTILRYRLVAADELILNWPGGIERLGAANVETRRVAADELAERATKDHERLLLELFSDPAPLVREIALKALRTTGGSKSNSALIKLLEDPEPNVRAAVLKQLAEKPSKSIVPTIVKYVAKEQDADLVVHAVRLLREAKGKQALLSLMTLLKHDSWRVRAEAAESISKLTSHREKMSAADKAAAYAALIRILDDEDGFVVSKVVAGLKESDLATAVKPLAAAAEKHPDLAVEIVNVLANGSHSHSATPHLRRFCKHESPQVRAAAIGGLCIVLRNEAGKELREALTDPESMVRAAAGEALFKMLGSNAIVASMVGGEFESVPQNQSLLGSLVGALLGGGGSSSESVVVESNDSGDKKGTDAENADDPDHSLKEIRQSKVHQKWLFDLVSLLKPLLKAESHEERLAAALPMTALGRDKQALPVLRNLLTEDPDLRPEIARALPWLLWDDRRQMFEMLTEQISDASQISRIATLMADRPDTRSIELLWSLIKDDESGGKLVSVLEDAVRQIYFPAHTYEPEKSPLSDRKRALADLTPRTKKGNRWQRLLALVVLMRSSPKTAGKLADEIFKDQSTDAALRADVLQMQLVNQSKSKSARTAIAALGMKDSKIRRRAIIFLARGAVRMRSLGKTGHYLNMHDSHYRSSLSHSSSVIEVEIPKGLTGEMILPAHDDPDPEVAAYAGYFSALFDDDRGLDKLIEFSQRAEEADEELDRLVYQAIATLDDSSKIPVLEKIYKTMQADNGRIRDFYWTIRAMTGPEILAFRKRIRQEVGMENLR